MNNASDTGIGTQSVAIVNCTRYYTRHATIDTEDYMERPMTASSASQDGKILAISGNIYAAISARDIKRDLQHKHDSKRSITSKTRSDGKGKYQSKES